MTRASVARSRLDVASSRSRIAGSTSSARTSAMGLALTGRKRPPPLGQDVAVATGEPKDELVRAHRCRSRLDSFVVRLGPAVGDVVADRAREQKCLLGHISELEPVAVEIERAEIDAVSEYPTLVRIVERASNFMTVDLPAPVSPTSAMVSPGCISRSIPLSA